MNACRIELLYKKKYNIYGVYIIKNMVLKIMNSKRRTDMNEKYYRLISQVGGGSIELGIIVLVKGIVKGTITIIYGSRLYKNKKKLILKVR